MNEDEFAKKIIQELNGAPISFKIQEGLTQARHKAINKTIQISAEKIQAQKLNAAGVNVAGFNFSNKDSNKDGNKDGNLNLWLEILTLVIVMVILAAIFASGVVFDNDNINDDDDDVNNVLQFDSQSFSNSLEVIEGLIKGDNKD